MKIIKSLLFVTVLVAVFLSVFSCMPGEENPAPIIENIFKNLNVSAYTDTSNIPKYQKYGNITVDGIISDAEWGNQNKLSTQVNVDGVTHNVEFSSAFSDEGLILYGKVSGAPVYYNPTRGPVNTALNFYVSTGNEENLQIKMFPSTDFYMTYRNIKTGKNNSYAYRVYNEKIVFAGNVDGDINSERSTGYTIECMIPWSTIGENASPDSVYVDVAITHTSNSTKYTSKTVSLSEIYRASDGVYKTWYNFNSQGYVETPLFTWKSTLEGDVNDYIFEAEAADMQTTSGGFLLSYGDAWLNYPSGSGCVEYLDRTQGSFTFYVTSSEDAPAILSYCMGLNSAVSASDAFNITVNGVKYDPLTPSITFPKYHTKQYYDWTEREIARIDLKKGDNVIVLTKKNANINFDYISIATAATLQDTRDVENGGHDYEWKASKQPTIESEGELVAYCKNCRAYQTKSIPAVSEENGYTRLSTGVVTRWQYTFEDFTITVDLANTDESTIKTHNFVAFVNDPFIAENGGSISGTIDVTNDTPRYENTRGQTFTTTITVSEDTIVDFIIKVESGTGNTYNNTCKGLFSSITLNGESVTINDSSVAGIGWGKSLDVVVARLELKKGTNVIAFTRTADTANKNNYNIWGVGFKAVEGVTITLGSGPAPDITDLTIDNVYAWVGYPDARFFPVFPKSQEETLTYEYDSTALTINAETNTITALKPGDYVVTAKSEHFSTTFTVKIEEVDKTSVKFDYSKFVDAAENRKTQWDTKGNDGETTIFIGDSFFDTYFWTDFYSNCYSGKDALCLGIGSTTTYDWEQWLDGWLGETSPKNIVMHIGTNNIYDIDKDNVDSANSALQRLFMLMHEKFPDTHIYWFGISQRSYDGEKIGYVTKINAIMQKWCDALEFITYIDTPSQLTNDMLKDKIHPKLECYSVFTSALAETDIVINDASGAIEDISFVANQSINNGTAISNVEYKGANLATNYVLSGKLDITSYNTNSHIQFGILDAMTNRILLWDNNSKGEFRLCIPYKNDDASVPVEDRYTMKDGETLTIEWKIVYHENNFYFFIGGELKLVYAAINNPNSIALTLGSEQTDCKFYDMQAVTLANDAEAYQGVIDDMADIIDAYDDITEYQKIRV